MVGLHTFWLIVASLICLYLYVEARRLRFHQHEGLPRPKTSLIWGHMKVIHEFYQKGDLRRHIGTNLFRRPSLLQMTETSRLCVRCDRKGAWESGDDDTRYTTCLLYHLCHIIT